MAAANFRIEHDVAGIPMAFIAERGSGRQVVALRRIAGFVATGCRRTAALVVGEWLQRMGGEGAVRLYITPAEEGGSGKVYMVRAGLFDDFDLVLN